MGIDLSSLVSKAENAVVAKATSTVKSLATSFTKPLTDTINSIVNGGTTNSIANANSTPVTWATTGNAANVSSQADWRVKVSLYPGSNIFYLSAGTGDLLYPLHDTNGVIFPISPQINVIHTAKYGQTSLTHSNYPMQSYESSEVGAIQINGEFPIQNITDGQYLLAAIYFFRAATKMFWGKDDLAGTPPPKVLLSGFGSAYFPNVPCVITSFQHTMPDDKDFIEIPTPGDTSGKTTRLPTQSSIQLTLQPLYSRNELTQFKLSDFANGKMLTKGFI